MSTVIGYKRYMRGTAARWTIKMLVAALSLSSSLTQAHTLPYLTWFNVERSMEVHAEELRITYNCTFNSTIFDPKSPLMDTDMDSTASAHEIGAFCLQSDQYLAADLLLLLNGEPTGAREESFYMRDDNSGFQTVFSAAMPQLEEGPHQVDWLDPAFLPIVLQPGMVLEETTTTITSNSPAIELVDVPNGNIKTKKIRMPSGFRTVVVFEKSAAGESKSASSKSKDDKTTSAVSGTR